MRNAKIDPVIRDMIEDRSPDRVLVVPDPSFLVQVFTLKRIELLSLIGDRTVNDLALLTRRQAPAISRDLDYLEAIGLISLVKKGRTVTPMLLKQSMLVQLSPRKKRR